MDFSLSIKEKLVKIKTKICMLFVGIYSLPSLCAPQWEPKSYSGENYVCHEETLFKSKWWAGAYNEPDPNGPTTSSQSGWGSQPWLPILDSRECISSNNNHAPSAHAGEDFAVQSPSSLVTIDGSRSHDQDGDRISYRWKQLSGPQVVLSNSNQAIANFALPQLSSNKKYEFELTVSDGRLSSVDTVSITGLAAVVGNRAPIAHAGNDIVVHTPNTVITLDGSRSFDEDGDSLTYHWQQVFGPALEIENEYAQSASVSIPDLENNEEYRFELTVSDGEATSQDQVTVSYTVNNELVSRTIHVEQLGKGNDIRHAQRRAYDPTPLQSTGFWVQKGETLNVSLEVSNGTISNLPKLFISLPDDRTYRFNHAEKHSLSLGTNRITVNKSGILYIYYDSVEQSNDINIELISGGSPFARFDINKNTDSDWQRMLNEYNDIPYVELVGNHVMITAKKYPAVDYIDEKGPKELLNGWDKIIEWSQEQYGITSTDRNSPHRKILHKFHYVDGLSPEGVNNPDTCPGALNAWEWRLMACSSGGLRSIFTVNNDVVSSWGPWHELGHHMQVRAFTWYGLGEVTVNLTSLFIERKFGLESRLETGHVWDTGIFPYLNSTYKNFSSSSVWTKLGMFWQLDLTFGEEFYKRLATNYRNNAMYNYSLSSEQQIQRFIIESSIASQYNLIPFFEKWGLNVNNATEVEIRNLDLRTLDLPIWENRDSNIRYKLYH